MRRLLGGGLVLALLAIGWGGTLQSHTTAPILVPGHYLAGSAAQPAEARATLAGQWEWHIALENDQGAAIVTFGLASDVVVIPSRDYDGDGYDDPAVYRLSDQTWYVLKSDCPGGTWTCSAALTVP